MRDKLQSVTQVAENLGVSERTVYRYMDQGMPRYRVGSGTFRFDMNEVLDWMREKTPTPTPTAVK